jgi:hypothetical protein
VQDSSTPTPQTATANLSITINPGNTNNLRLNGHYAFMLRGFDQNGLFTAAGSFVADGAGNISSGIMDTNTIKSLLPDQTFNGTYSIFQDGFGSMTFNITTVGSGSRSFELSMMANDNANIIEFDDRGGFTNNSARNSGVLLKQDPTAFSTSAISGSYAFGFLGVDSSTNRFGMAGEFQATVVNGQGTITGGQLDSDGITSASGSIAITGGAYSVASTGRGTTTITTAQGTATYAFYVVSATELLVIGIDPFAPGGNPLVSGTILGQTSASDFVPTSVFEVTGLNPSALTAESQVGLFKATSGSFTLTSDQNADGTLTQPTGSGGYSIASGRVTLSGSGFQNSPPVLYMVNSNNTEAFIIGTDTAVSFGLMTSQVQPGTYTSASLSGTYAGGSLAPVDANVSNVVSVAIAGSDTLNLTDYASGPNGLTANNPITASTSVEASGRVAVTENGNPQAAILYMVSPATVSPAQFFFLSGQNDPTARVDIFQQ